MGNAYEPCRAIEYMRYIGGFTQAQLAKRVKTSQGYISLCERGVRIPSAWLIDRIAKACGCRWKIDVEVKEPRR